VATGDGFPLPAVSLIGYVGPPTFNGYGGQLVQDSAGTLWMWYPNGTDWESISGGGGGGGITDIVGGTAITVTNGTGPTATVAVTAGSFDAAGSAATAQSNAETFATGAANAVLASSLQKANNLSDVADAGTSRFNISIPVLSAVAAVAVANVNIASGPASVDGYAFQTNDEVLLTAQSTASQNGVWIWEGTGNAFVRPDEFPSAGVVKRGRIVQVVNGTVYADTVWLLNSTAAGLTIDTTAQTWVEIPYLPLAGGTMSGPIAMGSHKITGLTNGSAATDGAAFGQIPVAEGSNPVAIGPPAAGATGDFSDGGHAHGMTTNLGAFSGGTVALSGTTAVICTSASLPPGYYLVLGNGALSGAIHTGEVYLANTAAGGATYSEINGTFSGVGTPEAAGGYIEVSFAGIIHVTVAGTMDLRGITTTGSLTSEPIGPATLSPVTGFVILPIG
jgi:hypothetical protein